MFGHQAPRRESAWPKAPRAKGARSLVSLSVFLAVALLLIGSLFMYGCGTGDTTTTGGPTTLGPTTTAVPAETVFPLSVTDDTDQKVTIKAKPVRIVSAAPSSTEILYALGLDDRIVGVNSLDDYPAQVKDVAKVGDFQISTEKVMSLSPDLVVAVSGVGADEALAAIKAVNIPVIMLKPGSVEEIYADIELLGQATGATAKAKALVESMKSEIKTISEAAAATGTSPKVFYAVDNTLWTSGPGSFVDHMLKLANATNVASDVAKSEEGNGYYQLTPEQLIAADPDVILVPNTAYKDVKEFTGDARFTGLRAVKEGHVYLVNDVVVTRPGPRITEGLKVLVDIIHPVAK